MVKLNCYNLSMHKVVVGLIPRIINNETEYLFISARKDFGEFTGLFYPPGGHLETGESEVETLIREVREELDISITPTEKLAESPGDVPNQSTYWYLCAPVEKDIEVNVDSVEIDKVIWIRENEINDKKEIFWPATYKFLCNYLKEKSSQHLS